MKGFLKALLLAGIVLVIIGFLFTVIGFFQAFGSSDDTTLQEYVEGALLMNFGERIIYCGIGMGIVSAGFALVLNIKDKAPEVRNPDETEK